MIKTVLLCLICVFNKAEAIHLLITLFTGYMSSDTTNNNKNLLAGFLLHMFTFMMNYTWPAVMRVDRVAGMIMR